MFFTNLNIFSIILFLWILCLIVFMIYRTYFDYKKNKNKLIFLSNIFLILSIFMLSIWIFWPKKISNSAKNYLWTNIVFVLDVSKSMNAIDIKSKDLVYSRLEASKKFIEEFLLNYPWNKYSLVVFAWEAIRILPFTSDTNLFSTFLSWVDSKNLSKQGSNLVLAINEWLKNFTKENDAWVLVLLSDWDDEKNLNLEKLNDKIKFLSIWVWTTKWSYIPIWKNIFGDTVYKTYKWWKVITKLYEENLKKIANFYNWIYSNLNDFWDFSKLDSTLNQVSKQSFIDNSENSLDLKRYISMFSFVFFLLYIIFLFLNNVKAKS